jgi:hypothetical protein
MDRLSAHKGLPAHQLPTEFSSADIGNEDISPARVE